MLCRCQLQPYTSLIINFGPPLLCGALEAIDNLPVDSTSTLSTKASKLLKLSHNSPLFCKEHSILNFQLKYIISLLIEYNVRSMTVIRSSQRIFRLARIFFVSVRASEGSIIQMKGSTDGTFWSMNGRDAFSGIILSPYSMFNVQYSVLLDSDARCRW